MGDRRSAPTFTRRLVALSAPLALVLSACSVLLTTDDKQCTSSDDCHKRGAAFANTVCVASVCLPSSSVGDSGGGADADTSLACIGSAKAQPTAPSGNVSVTMSFYNPVSPTKHLSGITIRACPKLDVTCTNALPGTSTSDSQGNATLTVPAGFDGYLEINGNGNGNSIVPALWYFSPFPVTDGTYNVGLFAQGDFQNIAQTSGATIDPSLGHSFAFALDCAEQYGSFTAGMSFDVDKKSTETRSFYLINGLPSTTATATDASGIGGFANLPTGIVTLTATLQSTGVRSGSSSVLIRAGVITYSPIAPGP
jgi:hypothetical protein